MRMDLFGQTVLFASDVVLVVENYLITKTQDFIQWSIGMTGADCVDGLE